MQSECERRKQPQPPAFVNGMPATVSARTALNLGPALVRSTPAAALRWAITTGGVATGRPAPAHRQFDVIPQYSGLRLSDRLFRTSTSEKLFAASRASRAVQTAADRVSNETVCAKADAVSTPSSPSPAAAPASGSEGSVYPFTEVEQRWQKYWLENKTFRTPEKLDTSKPKYYVLDMFPYPSGAGLHVGHPEGYTATDIIARYKRMRGFNVMHPMGWDAFGLPAEQYALETGTHPRVTTARNVARFRQQLQALGFSYDWEREVSTTDPEYYKWTQWIFLRLYERGLAYQAEVAVNWCPALGTVLANEEVIDGKSERGGHPVVRKPMRQWILKITEYAERLLEDLEALDWPENVKDMQRNWIGKSEGAELDFEVKGKKGKRVRVFTTRPDTLFGATYMVIAPEHPLVASIVAKERRAEVDAYVAKAATKSDLERTELQKEKSGVFTGAHAVNPVTLEPIPIYVADYVLASYGTGAIMAVPAHDKRDHEFARKYDLPIRQVVAPAAGEVDVQAEAFVTSDETAVLVNSAHKRTLSLDGLAVPAAKDAVCAWLEKQGAGEKKVNYKLRDWLFSRQRYWGEPFPIVFVDGKPVPLPDDALPVTLPEVESYKPSGTGESPLATVPEWVHTKLAGKKAVRETNTMPQWAGSCWYYLRFLDPRNETAAVDPEVEKYWMPVDLYVGGVEHAVLHLLYARFWHKVLFDCGVVSSPEPFHRLVNQGMILGEVEYTLFRDAEGRAVSAEEGEERVDCTAERVAPADVEKRGEAFVLKAEPAVRVAARAHKMSKSRGNVVNPDHVVAEYGADALRLYEMFMGPLEQVKTWSMKGVEGVHRFLNRAWRLYMEGASRRLSARVTDGEPTREQLRALHGAIKKVTEEVETMRFNTGISAMMEFVNAATKWETRPRQVMEPFVLLLAPYAPHIAEELWHALGHTSSLAYEPWPACDEQYLQADTITVVVQVNGKLRAQLQVSPGAGKEEVLAAARAEGNVAKFLEGKAIKKEVFVPGKLVNFVAA